MHKKFIIFHERGKHNFRPGINVGIDNQNDKMSEVTVCKTYFTGEKVNIFMSLNMFLVPEAEFI